MEPRKPDPPPPTFAPSNYDPRKRKNARLVIGSLVACQVGPMSALPIDATTSGKKRRTRALVNGVVIKFTDDSGIIVYFYSIRKSGKFSSNQAKPQKQLGMTDTAQSVPEFSKDEFIGDAAAVRAFFDKMHSYDHQGSTGSKHKSRNYAVLPKSSSQSTPIQNLYKKVFGEPKRVSLAARILSRGDYECQMTRSGQKRCGYASIQMLY